jgi:hypothetical protein
MLFICLTISSPDAAFACGNSGFAIRSFIDAWNHRTRRISVKTWQLKPYDGSRSLRQSVEFGLLLRVAVDKTGCLLKAELMSRREGPQQPDGFAALFGWLSLTAATNSKLSPRDRKLILERLDVTRDVAGGTVTVNGMTYTFFENAEVNNFSATPVALQERTP